MNYGAHLEIVRELRPMAGKPLLFGAMAPDFASMAGTRLNHELMTQKMTRGAHLHIAADTAFHSLDEFLALRQAGQAEIAKVLPPHPARVYSEMGIEILLDGIIFEDRSLGNVYDGVMCWALDNLESLGTLARNARQFKEVLVDRAEMGPPPEYDSPEAVAKIVHRQCRRRGPKLAFSGAHIPFLTSVYERQQESLKKCGRGLVEATIEALA